MRKRLYVDMDGTLAQFYKREDCLERMWEPGFFKSLEPYTTVVSALVSIIVLTDVPVYVLSAVNPEVRERTIKEKNAWLRKYFPECKNAIFCDVGESKAKIVGKIGKNDFLLDDYNANLLEWKANGGTAIKLVNEINDRGTNGPLWEGIRIRYDFTYERLYDAMCKILKV